MKRALISSVGERTKAIIESKGLKQKSVAEKAGYSPQVFNNLVNGRKLFMADDIFRVANALGVTPNELFGLPM